jgi:hypothetical protein
VPRGIRSTFNYASNAQKQPRKISSLHAWVNRKKLAPLRRSPLAPLAGVHLARPHCRSRCHFRMRAKEENSGALVPVRMSIRSPFCALPLTDCLNCPRSGGLFRPLRRPSAAGVDPSDASADNFLQPINIGTRLS